MTETENNPNMNKMLKDKYSLDNELRKGHGNDDLDAIQGGILGLLENLRFNSGTTLKEKLEEMKNAEALRLQEEAFRSAEAEAKARLENEDEDTSESDKYEDDDESHDSYLDGDDESGDDEDKAKEEEMNNMRKANPELANDIMKARADMEEKKKRFLDSNAEHLTDEERKQMIAMFDKKQQDIENQLRREQEDAERILQGKLNKRKNRLKKVGKDANKDVAEKVEEIAAIEDEMDEIAKERLQLEDKGINTKEAKRERDQDFKARCEEMDRDRDEKLSNIRQDYLNRISDAKTPQEKEKLLEEMGRRMKSVEESLADEKKRSEA
jgi:hypothetical protein